MDWLEEKAEKLKHYVQDSSLKKSLIYYLITAAIGAGTAYLLTRYMCRLWINVVSMKYLDRVLLDVKEAANLLLIDISRKDALILQIALVLYQYGLFLYMLGAIVLVVHFFVEGKIKLALKSTTAAITYLTSGDYAHEQQYHNQDEIGALCSEVELLRLKLIDEKRRQWENQEEQRNINAAFAHDMRTPLTVMQGYTEFLLKYIPQGKVTEEMLLEKLEIMKHQQERLLQFSMTMTEIRNLEMRQVNSGWYQLEEIRKRIRTAAEGMAAQSGKLVVMPDLHYGQSEVNAAMRPPELLLDVEMLLEVAENLLSNAGRYAKAKIEIQTELAGRKFTIYVKDDGSGFSPRALREASGLYYSEEKAVDSHFGIGLFISQNLCEKHGGVLNLVNSVDGGAIAAASFLVGKQ